MRILKKPVLNLWMTVVMLLISCGDNVNSSLLLAEQFTNEALESFFNTNIELEYAQKMRGQEPNALFGGKEWRAWLKGHVGTIDFIEAPKKGVLGVATGMAAYLQHRDRTVTEAKGLVRSKKRTRKELWSLFEVFREPKIGFLGHSLVTVSDPKNGFIQLTDGLGDYLADFSKSGRIIFVLSSLIHESRHFGGYGDSYGLRHAICPPDSKDQSMRGEAACDATMVGPYGTEILFTQYLLHAWKRGDEQGLFSKDAEAVAESISMRCLTRLLGTSAPIHPTENLDDHLQEALSLK